MVLMVLMPKTVKTACHFIFVFFMDTLFSASLRFKKGRKNFKM